jgi:hypothetical protein
MTSAQAINVVKIARSKGLPSIKASAEFGAPRFSHCDIDLEPRINSQMQGIQTAAETSG